MCMIWGYSAVASSVCASFAKSNALRLVRKIAVALEEFLRQGAMSFAL